MRAAAACASSLAGMSLYRALPAFAASCSSVSLAGANCASSLLSNNTTAISSKGPVGSTQSRLFASGSSAKQGPVYIVFGATGGIGSALCDRLVALAAAGQPKPGSAAPAALVLSADHDATLKELQGRIRGAGGGCTVDAMPADATDPNDVDNVVREAIARHGRLDGVVNCVGNVAARSTLATDLQQLQEELQINLFTSFNIVKASVKAMVGKEAQQQQQAEPSGAQPNATHSSVQNQGGGGSIVLVSAALASHGLPNFESMSAAKAGVEGLARSAAATYARHNIRVNCVAPGLTRTGQTKKFTENQRVAGASEQMTPLKELAEPHQVAAALEFFLAPENDFITGQVLAVDGGLSTLHLHHAQEYGV